MSDGITAMYDDERIRRLIDHEQRGEDFALAEHGDSIEPEVETEFITLPIEPTPRYRTANFDIKEWDKNLRRLHKALAYFSRF